MHDNDWLAQRFEENRARLTAIASRMLGSAGDADDAVQEAWLRLSRSDADSIENLGSWLTTVLSRVCLNILQARRSRSDTSLNVAGRQIPADGARASDPEHEALLADSIGLALTIMLNVLSPGERVAFVLHDIFGVPFEEIAPIVGRSAAATRKLASRARRLVRMQDADQPTNALRQAKLVEAFLAAARTAISINSLLYSILVSFCAPIAQRSRWGRLPRLAGPSPSLGSAGTHTAPCRLSWMELPRWRGCPTGSSAWSSSSPPRARR